MLLAKFQTAEVLDTIDQRETDDLHRRADDVFGADRCPRYRQP